jgi:uncharacterized protein
MKILTPIFAVIGSLGMLCLMSCTSEDQSKLAQPAVTYTLNTPLHVIEDDPRGMMLLQQDVPEIMFNNNYKLSPFQSLADVEILTPSTLPQSKLAKVQVDLAQLSAEEQAAQNPGGSYVPAPVYTTSFSCGDGNTAVQNAVCGNPQLASLDLQMAGLVRQHLGDGAIFERDQVLSFQRSWLLGLGSACGLTGASATAASPSSVSCLEAAYQSQISTLANWPAPPADVANVQGAAIAKYVTYKLLDAKQPALCQAIGSAANAAISSDGAIDPAQLDGAQEIAGSHGPASGANPQGGSIAVDIYRADLYAGYQIRARGLALSGGTAPLIGPETLGNYVQTMPNGGGRFVSFPSQTGDYGAIDAFSYQGQLLALVTDTVGYNSPASPGESAVAGVFSISQGGAAPVCLFETFLMPPPVTMGMFSAQPSLTPFLALLSQIEGAPPANLAPSDRQDLTYFQSEQEWTMFYMPLVINAQARNGNWTGWLRYRHDQVLDNLYAWSQKSQQNQTEFNQLFSLLSPAASDLQTIYVQQQGLTAAQAEQATAITMMELLYQATVYLDPSLGSGPADPASYANYHPRYPILANPQ